MQRAREGRCVGVLATCKGTLHCGSQANASTTQARYQAGRASSDERPRARKGQEGRPPTRVEQEGAMVESEVVTEELTVMLMCRPGSNAIARTEDVPSCSPTYILHRTRYDYDVLTNRAGMY